MKKTMAAVAATLVALAWPGTMTAHHSIVRFDTSKPVWLKGTVIRFERVAPHAFIYLEQTNGAQPQRWVVDGPAPNALSRAGIGADFLKAGDVVEVCGFPLKAEFDAQAAASPASATLGRAFSGHLLIMPNGKRQYWSDYGVLEKCLLPGETVQQLREETFGPRK